MGKGWVFDDGDKKIGWNRDRYIRLPFSFPPLFCGMKWGGVDSFVLPPLLFLCGGLSVVFGRRIPFVPVSPLPFSPAYVPSWW